MYREQHMLVYRTEDAGKLVWNLTIKQAGWLGLGLYLTMTLIKVFPGIPGIGIWGHTPHVIPLVFSAAFAFGKQRTTGMNLWGYIISWISCRKRKRVFSDFGW